MEKKGKVKGRVKCPQCSLVTDLEQLRLNPETLSEDVGHGQYRRPTCKCGCGFGYNDLEKVIEKQDVDTARS